MDLPLFARPLFGPRSVALIIVHRILKYLQGRRHTKQDVMIFCTGHRFRRLYAYSSHLQRLLRGDAGGGLPGGIFKEFFQTPCLFVLQ